MPAFVLTYKALATL